MLVVVDYDKEKGKETIAKGDSNLKHQARVEQSSHAENEKRQQAFSEDENTQSSNESNKRNFITDEKQDKVCQAYLNRC